MVRKLSVESIFVTSNTQSESGIGNVMSKYAVFGLLMSVMACGGSSSTTPVAPTATATTSTAMLSTNAVTFSGTVTNIVTGTVVSGATVTIGTASATTGTDGMYSLEVTASGQPTFSVSASGYHTRESAVSMSGATTINPEIIPDGDGFDLSFFDYLFRENGTQGTARRTATPTYEIWTRQFTCLELSTDGYNACVRMQALEAEVPAEFETLARDAIAKIGQLSGNVLTNAIITTKSHTPGTILKRDDWGTASGVVSIEYQTTGLWVDANNNGNDACFCSPVSETGPGHIVYGTVSGLDLGIHVHEVGHSVGFGHPSGTPTQSTFMFNHPYTITPADELHGRILYKRPNGSLTPDTDPTGVTIN